MRIIVSTWPICLASVGAPGSIRKLPKWVVIASTARPPTLRRSSRLGHSSIFELLQSATLLRNIHLAVATGER